MGGPGGYWLARSSAADASALAASPGFRAHCDAILELNDAFEELITDASDEELASIVR